MTELKSLELVLCKYGNKEWVIGTANNCRQMIVALERREKCEAWRLKGI